MKGFNEATTSVAYKVKKTITESTKTDKGVKVGAFSVEKNNEDRYNIIDTRKIHLIYLRHPTLRLTHQSDVFHSNCHI